MLKQIRLQWHIAWRKVKPHQIVKFWLFSIIVGIVNAPLSMGYCKKQYTRDYIPFQVVLKKNFLLQEQLLETNNALIKEQEYAEKYYQLAEKYKQTTFESIEITKVNNTKIATFEGIVKQIEKDSLEHRKLRQENIKLALDLKKSQQEIIKLRIKLEELSTMEPKLIRVDKTVLSQDAGRVNIDDDTPEAPIDGKLLRVTELPHEGNVTISNDYEIQEVVEESSLNEYKDGLSEESVSGSRKVRDVPSEEKIELSDSDRDSSSIDTNTGDQSEVDQIDEDFIVEDGIQYMFVARCSMTRQYILMDEKEDENWFPKTKVYEELEAFLYSEHDIIGKGNCTQRQSDLTTILEGIKKGMKDQIINDEFLNLAFMMLYETIDCQDY